MLDSPSTVMTATYGVRWWLCTRPRMLGSEPARPMANSTRAALLTAAAPHARLELTSAMKTIHHAAPQWSCANWIQSLPSVSAWNCTMSGVPTTHA